MKAYLFRKLSTTQKRRISKASLLVSLVAVTTACAGTPVVTTASAGCSSLIPPSWEQGIAGAPLPADDSVGSWISFGDQQTGKLDTANARTRDAIEIQRRCEARDKDAVRRATRGFFGRIFG